MRKHLLAVLGVLSFVAISNGDQKVARGFRINNGHIELFGTFEKLSGILAQSSKEHLSVETVNVPDVGKIERKLPFDATAIIVNNRPSEVVFGVLGQAKRKTIKGSTPTSILYGGTDPKTDLKVLVGLGENGPVEIPYLPADGPASSVPPHVSATLARLVGDWTSVTQTQDGRGSSSDVKFEWAIKGMAVRYQWKSKEDASEGFGLIGWDAVRKVVVEHQMNSNGSVSSATHHISKESKWTSPMRGTRTASGNLIFYELNRTIELISKDSWNMNFRDIFHDGEKQPDISRSYKRNSSE